MSNRHYYPQQPNYYVTQPPMSEYEQFILRKEQRWKRPFIIAGICLIGFIVLSFICLFLFVKVDDDKSIDEEIIKKALEQQISTQIPVRTKLLKNQKHTLQSLNFSVLHNDKQDTSKIHIWDIGLLDGEYVQVFVDGEPLAPPFLLRSFTKTFIVPNNAVIEVKGIHEVENGIQYGIMFSSNEKSYFNNVLEGKSNTYLLQMSN